jgi:Domain of unknown function (DUF4105)
MKSMLKIKQILWFLLFVTLQCVCFAQTQLSPKSEISILSCSPGTELYSLFGHSALRVQDQRNGKIMDLVFNYGTFDYSDDFYYQFAMGKLDYKLSISHFGDFQKEYIDEMRGIHEQKLILTHSQKSHLWQLLQTNYEPALQTYRYDFFYDNCSTRIRDIILLAYQLAHDYPLADSIAASAQVNYFEVLKSTFPRDGDPSTRTSLSNDHSVLFTYTYPEKKTFRETIDQYLRYQPWSDFGIDIALGLPCDRVVLQQQGMFLPDSLEKEFHYAHAGENLVVERSEEILPSEIQFFTPFWMFSLVLILGILLTLVKKKKWPTLLIVDRVFLSIVGLIGCLVVFLWFFTDHHATVGNLNILWAHPLWLFMAWLPPANSWAQKLYKFCGAIILMTLLSFVFLPQQLHVATIPIMLFCVLICAKFKYNSVEKGEKSALIVPQQ